MGEGKTPWVLKHFCLLVSACILCLAVGLFLGRMLLRQNMGALAVETERSVIAEAAAAPPGEDLINLNTASAKELAELPGIGEALAARIIAYRQENGPFRYPYEIMNIPGIEEKTYSAIRDRITVG